MAFSHIVFEWGEDGIAALTVNRPGKLNALNREILAELDAAFQQSSESPEIRGLILTGAGEKAFVAGADIGELAGMSPVELEAASRYGQEVFRRLETMGKPSVAAINGFALGGGLELALACALRVASPNAKMGMPEVKLGFIPGYGGTQRLPRLVGRGTAMELLLTGEPADAEEALRVGLVNHVVPQDRLLGFCRQLLAKILANGPVAVRLAMESVDAGLNCGVEEGLKLESKAFGLAGATNDFREGAAAFLEKRKPAFTGK